MYGFPTDMDLSAAVGQETTQLRVGPADLQLSFGDVAFAIQSRAELMRSGKVVGIWEAGHLPDTAFYQIFNNPIDTIGVIDEKRLGIRFRDGLELHLLDTSDQYESVEIYADGGPWFV